MALDPLSPNKDGVGDFDLFGPVNAFPWGDTGSRDGGILRQAVAAAIRRIFTPHLVHKAESMGEIFPTIPYAMKYHYYQARPSMHHHVASPGKGFIKGTKKLGQALHLTKRRSQHIRTTSPQNSESPLSGPPSTGFSVGQTIAPDTTLEVCAVDDAIPKSFSTKPDEVHDVFDQEMTDPSTVISQTGVTEVPGLEDTFSISRTKLGNSPSSSVLGRLGNNPANTKSTYNKFKGHRNSPAGVFTLPIDVNATPFQFTAGSDGDSNPGQGHENNTNADGSQKGVSPPNSNGHGQDGPKKKRRKDNSFDGKSRVVCAVWASNPSAAPPECHGYSAESTKRMKNDHLTKVHGLNLPALQKGRNGQKRSEASMFEEVYWSLAQYVYPLPSLPVSPFWDDRHLVIEQRKKEADLPSAPAESLEVMARMAAREVDNVAPQASFVLPSPAQPSELVNQALSQLTQLIQHVSEEMIAAHRQTSSEIATIKSAIDLLSQQVKDLSLKDSNHRRPLPPPENNPSQSDTVIPAMLSWRQGTPPQAPMLLDKPGISNVRYTDHDNNIGTDSGVNLESPDREMSDFASFCITPQRQEIAEEIADLDKLFSTTPNEPDSLTQPPGQSCWNEVYNEP